MSNQQEKTSGMLAASRERSADSDASCVLDAEGHCITCSDEALPARVLRIDYGMGMALVETEAGGREEVDITLVEEVEPDGWLLVHGGVAIANLQAQTASEAGHE
jgi:hydrogenase maturation factor